MSWAITTCDGHINCWQSKVWKPQNMELPYTEWSLIENARTLQCAGQRHQCINVTNCAGKYYSSVFLLHHTNNMSVAIARIVTATEIRVLLSQKVWQTKVAISTSVTDWLLLSSLLGKSCINVAIVTPWRTRVDVCVKHFIAPHNFFAICYRHFMFTFSQLFRKKAQKLQLQLKPLWMHHCEIDVTIALMSVRNLMLLIYHE